MRTNTIVLSDSRKFPFIFSPMAKVEFRWWLHLVKNINLIQSGNTNFEIKCQIIDKTLKMDSKTE